MANAIPSQSYVLVIGSAGIDSKGRAGGPLTLGTSTPGNVRVSVGGVARNVADNLTRLGEQAVLLSAIGQDGSGKRILNNAAEVGINTEFCIVSDTLHTSAYLALLDENGNLVMSVDDMRVMACITPKLIEDRRDLIKKARMVVIDSNLSQESINTVFRCARRYKVRVCADPTSTVLAPRLKPHLSRIYMITPNIAEAQVLSECTIKSEDDAITAARQLVARGVEIAMITLAEEGVVYATANASGHVPAMATELVDSTGASDALTATVVFALLNDIPIDEAVRLGVSAAALTLATDETVYPELSLDLLYDSLVI
ncbi:MAG: Pseudouridine kinase [Anaerolineae bacterium]|nr:Pseudouridine kinase [Anaerolineae bacterium]